MSSYEFGFGAGPSRPVVPGPSGQPHKEPRVAPPDGNLQHFGPTPYMIAVRRRYKRNAPTGY